MAETEPQGEEFDPYAPENIGGLQFITLARIYDALMGIYSHLNPGAAKDLLELHASGVLVGSAPIFEGNFVTDIINNVTPIQKNVDDA
jgi:hypothetical protein